MEAFMKESGGGDHISVGMRKPNGEYERPITGTRLFWTNPGYVFFFFTLQQSTYLFPKLKSYFHFSKHYVISTRQNRQYNVKVMLVFLLTLSLASLEYCNGGLRASNNLGVVS